MEVRSYDRRSVPRSLKGTIETTSTSQYNSSKRQLRLLYPAKVKYDGPVTGKPYEWDNAGSIVAVDAEDADPLLQIYIGGRGCCGAGGNPNGNQMFDEII